MSNLKYLPPALRDSLQRPRRILWIWLVLSLLMFYSSLTHAAAIEIRIEGPQPFSFTERRDGHVELTWGPSHQSLDKIAEGGWQLSDSGKVRSSLKPHKEGFILSGESGEARYRVKEREAGDDSGLKLKILDAKTNQPLFRVKIKVDKFNIYDGADKRVMHGKFKDGKVTVKSEEDVKLLTIAGENRLTQAAALALPLDPGFRVLLWRAMGAKP
jgi:hypothetical protein